MNRIKDKTNSSYNNKTDLCGHLIRKLYAWNKSLICVCSTTWCRIKMNLWGITYGKRCEFRGNTIFFRGQDSIITLGKRCVFNSNSRFNYRGINHPCILQATSGGKISIGNHFKASGVSIVSNISVTIGNDVMCGANVSIGDRNDHEDRYPEWQPKPIIIGSNVWLGMNCVVMRGVTIGDDVVIGANSVVTKNIPSNVIAAGNPCKVIRERKQR